ARGGVAAVGAGPVGMAVHALAVVFVRLADDDGPRMRGGVLGAEAREASGRERRHQERCREEGRTHARIIAHALRRAVEARGRSRSAPRARIRAWRGSPAKNATPSRPTSPISTDPSSPW